MSLEYHERLCSQLEGISAGVDWITATIPADAQFAATWVRRCQAHIEELSLDGYIIQPKSILGYTGMGFGNTFVGTRNDGHMCIISGHNADSALSVVNHPQLHISRIDVQVTAKFKKMPSRLAKEAYKDAILENSHLSPQRQRNIRIMLGNKGGDTLYIGSPTSRERARLYNKEVESEQTEYTRSWRYEVTYINQLATAVYSSLMRRDADMAVYISNIVAIWFEKRGVACPWTFDEEITPKPLSRATPTDIEAKINWLRTQVAPTVKHLIGRGYCDTLLEALGFIEPHENV